MDEIRIIHDRKQILQKTLDDLHVEINQIQLRLDGHDQVLESVRTRSSTAQAGVAVYHEMQTKLRLQQYGEMFSQVASLEAAGTKYRESSEQIENDISETSESNQSILRTLESLRLRHGEHKKCLDRLGTEKEALHQELNRVADKTEVTKRQVDRTQSLIDDTQYRMESVELEVRSYQSKRNLVADELQQINQSITVLTGLDNDLNSRIKEQEQLYESTASQLHRLVRSAIQPLEIEVNQFSQLLQQQTVDEKDVLNLEDRLSLRLSSLRKEYRDLLTLLDQKRARLVHLLKQKEEASVRSEKEVRSAGEAQNRLTAVQRINGKALSELEAALSAIADENRKSKELTRKLGKLREMEANQFNELSLVQANYKSTQISTETVKTDIMDYDSRIKKLERGLDKLHTQLTRTNHEASVMRSKLQSTAHVLRERDSSKSALVDQIREVEEIGHSLQLTLDECVSSSGSVEMKTLAKRAMIEKLQSMISTKRLLLNNHNFELDKMFKEKSTHQDKLTCLLKDIETFKCRLVTAIDLKSQHSQCMHAIQAERKKISLLQIQHEKIRNRVIHPWALMADQEAFVELKQWHNLQRQLVKDQKQLAKLEHILLARERAYFEIQKFTQRIGRYSPVDLKKRLTELITQYKAQKAQVLSLEERIIFRRQKLKTTKEIQALND